MPRRLGCWGTFQDRLSSELRLAGAGTREQADQVLWRYLPRHNRRFTVPAQDPATAWIAWPAGRHLDDVFCFKYRRLVGNDNTVRFGDELIYIPPSRTVPRMPMLGWRCRSTWMEPCVSITRGIALGATAARARSTIEFGPSTCLPSSLPLRWRRPPDRPDPDHGDPHPIIRGEIRERVRRDKVSEPFERHDH
jgi:hypothetical protein